MLASSRQCEVVQALRRRMEGIRRGAAGSFSSGCRGLDQILPGHSLPRGSLVEYLAEPGSGGAAVALVAAQEACREGGALVVIDRPLAPARSWFYPPGGASFGIDGSTIFVRPRARKDELWALNQSLGTRGVGAVLCWPERLDDRSFRALQLAAENSGAIGLFVRSMRVRGDPTWSELQLLIETLPGNRLRRLRVEVVRCRNGNAGASVELELNDETATLQESRFVPVAAPMAVAAASV